jgi:hypothetical protein
LKHRRISFSHIVNTTNKNELLFAQNVTIESMLNAKKKSINKVELLHTAFNDEYQEIKEFKYAGDLKKSAKDIKKFKIIRKLPLIHEIFDNGYLSSTNEYFVYTNIDIALMPDFYNQISKIINKGYDCIIVNRKNINKTKYTNILQLKEMYSDPGESHLGMDCFVFKRDIIPGIVLKELLLGVKSVDVGIYFNIVALSSKVYHEKQNKFTFHIGEDGEWKSQEFLEYNMHNKSNNEYIVNILKKKKIYSSIFEKRNDAEQYISWMNDLML